MNINLTLLMQAVAFFAFILFTAKFIWPPLMRAIETRQKQIADGLAAGEGGKQSLEASAKQSEGNLKASRDRPAEIIAQAEKRGVQLVEEAKTVAKEESGREKTAAKAEIE